MLFGGVRRIAKVSEYVLPAMAVVYVGLALLIIILNIGSLGSVLRDIFESAFGLKQALAGTAGGLSAALLNGAKRGLFSNEAGMGSAPNAAATATTNHPAKQGLIQSLGVFVDTMIICTATSFIILMAGDHLYHPGEPEALTGAPLTQAAVAAQFGSGSKWLMTVLVLTFAFSSLLGNYSYAEVNLNFLRANPLVINVFRLVVIAAVGLGSILALNFVWNFADVAMALMALVNLVAIVLLGKWAFALLRDYERQRRAGADPAFVPAEAGLPATLETDSW